MNIIKLEDINEELARGTYGDIEVIFLKENGYINISKLCKYGLTKEGNTKEFSKWLDNNNSKELIDIINKELKVTRNSSIPIQNECLIKRLDFANDHKGYYVHKFIAIQVCQWISPLFALRISKMYDDYARRKYEIMVNNKDKKIVDLEILIEENRIRHEEAMNLSKQQHQELSCKHNLTLEELRILRIRSDEQLSVNEDLLYKYDITNNKLDDIKDSMQKININEINNTTSVNHKNREMILLISVLFSNNDLIYIINRCQISSYKYIRV